MKIVIEIPEETYNFIKENSSGSTAHEAIKNGTPLPKGHGRLIDADELKTIRSIQNKYANFNSIETIQEWIDHAPTIIEADTVIEADKKKRDCKNCKNCVRTKSYDYNGYYKQYFPRYHDFCKVGGGDEGAFSEYCNKFQRKEAEETDHGKEIQ